MLLQPQATPYARAPLEYQRVSSCARMNARAYATFKNACNQAMFSRHHQKDGEGPLGGQQRLATPDREEPAAAAPPPAKLALLPAPATALPDQHQGVKRSNEDVVSDRLTRTRREDEDEAQKESMLDATDAMNQATAEQLEVEQAQARVEQAKVNARGKLEQATRDSASASLAQATAGQEQRDQQNAEAARLLQETQYAEDQEVKDQEAQDLTAKEDAASSDASGDEGSRGALALAQAAAEIGDEVPSATASDPPTCGFCLQVMDHMYQELEALGCSHVYHKECLDDLIGHTPGATRQNCCPLKCNSTPYDEHVGIEAALAATLVETDTQPPPTPPPSLPQPIDVELADVCWVVGGLSTTGCGL